MSTTDFPIECLHRLARAGDFSQLRKCLDKGADPTSTDDQSNTLAHSVVLGAQTEMAAMEMIERINGCCAPEGCAYGEVHSRNQHGRTPAMLADQQNFHKLLEALVDNNAQF